MASAELAARAIRSGQITGACLDNGMSESDACETAAVLLPLLDTMLAVAWDEGHGTSNGGCVYWPDCAEIGHHVNPYRPTLDGEDEDTCWCDGPDCGQTPCVEAAE